MRGWRLRPLPSIVSVRVPGNKGFATLLGVEEEKEEDDDLGKSKEWVLCFFFFFCWRITGVGSLVLSGQEKVGWRRERYESYSMKNMTAWSISSPQVLSSEIRRHQS